MTRASPTGWESLKSTTPCHLLSDLPKSAGEITAQTAALTGLKAGTPVVGGLFDVVSTALCAGIEDEFTLNAVMGTGR